MLDDWMRSGGAWRKYCTWRDRRPLGGPLRDRPQIAGVCVGRKGREDLWHGRACTARYFESVCWMCACRRSTEDGGGCMSGCGMVVYCDGESVWVDACGRSRRKVKRCAKTKTDRRLPDRESRGPCAVTSVHVTLSRQRREIPHLPSRIFTPSRVGTSNRTHLSCSQTVFGLLKELERGLASAGRG